MIVQENIYPSPEPGLKSENVLSSGVANMRLSVLPIGAVQQETNDSSQYELALSSKPSHKNNNLSKKEINSLNPNFMGQPKQTPTGILKPASKFSRETSLDSAKLEVVRENFRQPPLPATRRQQESRIHQSVTYSPVSHCVTRDAVNIFEKKKQRMQKIQQLRGISNNSEILKNEKLEVFKEVADSDPKQEDSHYPRMSHRLQPMIQQQSKK